MADLAIETSGLRKLFGSKVAVEDLTLEVERGEVFGFLGPNGAGKSTSVKMLLGLISPSGGQARVLGRPIGDVGARQKVGFLPEHFHFHDWLSGAEFLDLHGRLYGVDAGQRRARASELLDRVGLTPHAGKRLGDYSKGMLQRIGLAQALLNEPDLIFLDEPTSGLDLLGRRLVRDIIREQRGRGAAVFLNSHLLGEVEITCDRVAFIRRGNVLEVGDMDQFMSEQLAVTVRADNLSPDLTAGLRAWANTVTLDGDRMTFRVDEEEVLPEILQYLISRGVRVSAFTPEKISLEDRFIEIIGTEGGL